MLENLLFLLPYTAYQNIIYYLLKLAALPSKISYSINSNQQIPQLYLYSKQNYLQISYYYNANATISTISSNTVTDLNKLCINDH
jgi:hypothetical protein